MIDTLTRQDDYLIYRFNLQTQFEKLINPEVAWPLTLVAISGYIRLCIKLFQLFIKRCFHM